MTSSTAFFRRSALLGLTVLLCACASRVPLDNPGYPPVVIVPVPMPAPRVVPGPQYGPVVAAPPVAVQVRPILAPGAAFLRPAAGPMLARFERTAHPGIDIGGIAGDPVAASRDGRVVLVSSALPAYGTMVVVQHDDQLITAYAHLGRVLVAENDTVRQGQPIAEMGSSGTDKPQLRFEIRKAGVAVDPEPYLQGAVQ